MADTTVFVTSDQISSERRVSSGWTIGELKTKLEQITGIPPTSQKLRIYGSASTDKPVDIDDSDESVPLAKYNPVPYGRIHVEDLRPPGTTMNLNDTSQVEKYVMPETQYGTRDDTVLQWKKRNQLGRFDPSTATNAEQLEHDSHEIVQSRGIEVGQRCQIMGSRVGTVRYVGKVPEINPHTYWVGVELDEPQGKNNGQVKGQRYFQCKDNHGSFVKPEMVEIGDFEEDDLDEL